MRRIRTSYYCPMCEEPPMHIVGVRFLPHICSQCAAEAKGPKTGSDRLGTRPSVMQVYDGLDDDTDQPIVRGGQGRSAQEVVSCALRCRLVMAIGGLLALGAVIYLLGMHR